MGHILAAEVLHLDMLEILPDTFVRVQLRGIAGKSLQLKASRRALGKVVLESLAAMDGSTLPNNYQISCDLLLEQVQKTDNAQAVKSGFAYLQIQVAVRTDRTDDREVVAGEFVAQHGGLARRRPRSYHAGQQIEGALVYKQEFIPACVGPFLRAGRRSWHHCWMATASRFVARQTGLITYPGFIIHHSSFIILLVTPATGMQQGTDIIRMIHHPEDPFYHGGDAFTRPDIAREAETWCAACEQVGYLSALDPGKATGCAAGRAFLEGFDAFFASALDPLADGSGGSIEFLGDVFLLPPLLVELPGTQASSFAPIFTLW